MSAGDMIKGLLPLLMIVAANTCYNVCTKSFPKDADACAGLTVTNLTAAVLSAALFAFGGGRHGLFAELARLNWTSPVLGAAIVALETGFVLLYRAGWKISAGALTANTCLAVALLFVGVFAYRETITARQIAGMFACAAGLYLING